MDKVNANSHAPQESVRTGMPKRQWLAIQEARATMDGTLCRLEQIVKGATFRQDQNLLEFVGAIRKKILVKKQGWLPQKYFLEQPSNLFWVEGTSLAILYNYIPRGAANVYVVAYTCPLVNLTRMKMAMSWAKSDAINNAIHCQFVCGKTRVFVDTDLVWTKDPELYEKHRAKIDFFAGIYVQEPKEESCALKTMPTNNMNPLETPT